MTTEMKLTCRGTTRKGEPCTKYEWEHGYCRQHQSQVPEEQTSVQVQGGAVTGVEPVVAQRRQTRPERRAAAKRASRLARRVSARPRRSETVGFSRPTTPCHAKPMPRGIDLQVKASLHHYRTWASPKTADEREEKRRRRIAELQANEKAARARQKAAAQ